MFGRNDYTDGLEGKPFREPDNIFDRAEAKAEYDRGSAVRWDKLSNDTPLFIKVILYLVKDFVLSVIIILVIGKYLNIKSLPQIIMCVIPLTIIITTIDVYIRYFSKYRSGRRKRNDEFIGVLEKKSSWEWLGFDSLSNILIAIVLVFFYGWLMKNVFHFYFFHLPLDIFLSLLTVKVSLLINNTLRGKK